MRQKSHHLRAVGAKAKASNPDRDSTVTGKPVNPFCGKRGRQGRGGRKHGKRSGNAEKISSSDRAICQEAFLFQGNGSGRFP